MKLVKHEAQKLYKPQTKKCTRRTRRKFCTYVLFTTRFFIVCLIFYTFTFTAILLP